MFKENGIMNEENAKLAKIKKSCRIGKKVSNILFILMLVGAICLTVYGIKVFADGKKFDDQIKSAEAAGVISTSDEIGSVSGVSINLGSLPTNLHSDVPAIQAAIDDHPYSIFYGSWITFSGVGMLIIAILMLLVKSVFATIEKESTPFTPKVKKKVTVVLIIISALFLCTTGTGFAVIGALITWAVNAILDYGMTLQTQYDETL